MSLWAIISLVCGLFALAVGLLVVGLSQVISAFNLPWTQGVIDLATLAGLYSSGFGIALHFVARRQIALSACLGPTKVEGDLTAIAGFSLCLLCWLFLQLGSQLLVRWGGGIAVGLGMNPETALGLISSFDFIVACCLALLGLLYVLVSGPPVTRLLTPLILILVPVLLLFSGLLHGREEARKNAIEQQLRRAGQGFYFKRELLRQAPF
jgi:hypothetical protein